MSNYTIGLAGLQNTSLAIDNTSNNIANANTVGYKAGEYIFADQYFKAIDPSDVNRVGQGSQRLAIRRPLTYGTLQNSQNPLDMAIGGDGWFRVLSNPEDPSSLMYTRNGQFAVDKNGWIVNQNGMYLTGFQPAADGKSITDDIRGLGTVNGKLRMPPDYANGVQTSVSKISAILDKRENAFVTAGNVAFDPTQNTFNSKTTQTIFDANGTGHTLEVYYRRVSDTNLQIKSGTAGYTYRAGYNATPNTAAARSDKQVVVPGTSALTVQTAPVATLYGNLTGQTKIGSGPNGTAYVSFESGNVSYSAGRVSMDASGSEFVISGAPISSDSLIGKTLFVGTDDQNVYVEDVTALTANTALDGAVSDSDTNLTVDSAADIQAGMTLFINGVSTGKTVTEVDGNDLTLSGAVSQDLADGDTVSFKGTLVSLNASVDPISDTSITFKGVDLFESGLSVGDKIFMNGVDTDLTVATAYAATVVNGQINTAARRIYKVAVEGGNIDIPASASFNIYKADIDGEVATSSNTDLLSIVLADAGDAAMKGRRLFVDDKDTGLTVKEYDNDTQTVTLDGVLDSSITIAIGSSLKFKQTLDMTLTAPDGTNIIVQGTTNKQSSDSILNAVQENLEVYASIDGVFYDYSDQDTTRSSKPGIPDVQTTNGYKTVAKIGLVAGRNIDSLMVDTASGKPVFSTSTKLETRVSAGSQQSTTIPLIYELDLSDTQLQASSFMVNQSYQNGEPRSELSSVSIDSTGMIVGVYGNGRKIVAGQIALTQFDADEQLIPTGNNAFAPSYRSGTEGDNGVRIGRAGDGSFGEIKSMAVEASTVDLSNELVKLMILQRMYSANSQSIKAFDQTLQDTIRMTG